MHDKSRQALLENRQTSLLHLECRTANQPQSKLGAETLIWMKSDAIGAPKTMQNAILGVLF